MVTKKTSNLRIKVVENGVKFYDMYMQTRFSFLGIPLYTSRTFMSRERALIQ